jgi:hypothetical protein
LNVVVPAQPPTHRIIATKDDPLRDSERRDSRIHPIQVERPALAA